MRIDTIKRAIAEILHIASEDVDLELPPSPAYGDFSISVFTEAKKRRVAPLELAENVAGLLLSIDGVISAAPMGGYINITLDYDTLFQPVKQIANSSLVVPNVGAGQTVMVESFSPNTNKPLHVGHLRNLFIGDALSNILEFSGYKVIRATLYNDRGIHISKSQLAYTRWGAGLTPSISHKKGDHFVGDYYVMFGKKAEQDPDLEKEAQAILRRWEASDIEVRSTWQTLRDWVVEGFDETVGRLGIRPFDVVYWESEFWKEGLSIVGTGLEKGIFQRGEDNAVVADVPGLGIRPVLRGDGTALYITQDIYLATRKFREYGPLAKSIYVVAAEQADHFKSLFHILDSFGFVWAANCHHLAYGMILLKGGKLKSREGITADADRILDVLEDMAHKEIQERYPNLSDDDRNERARIIALSAIKWDFLKIGTLKNINFDIESSLSLKGDTGPYLLYAYARTRALLRKAGINELPPQAACPADVLPEERGIAATLHLLPEIIIKSATSYNFSFLCAYLHSLAEKFNAYYQIARVIGTPEPTFSHRIAVAVAVGNALKAGLRVLGIETLEEL